MMIVIFKKHLSGLAGLFFLIMLLSTFLFGKQHLFPPVSSPGYQIRQQFPPLVFLPDYQSGPAIRAGAAVLIEARSGTVLFAKNGEMRRAPASTTKMLTAIVALEKGRLNQVIKVSKKAAATGGSSIWLKSGDRLTLGELLEGTMLRSGNDGSVAIAEGVAGSVEIFVNWMNLKAKEIGALQTNFKNPHGLRAPSHYTTALDLALIARYGLANPQFARLVSKKEGHLQWLDRQRQVEIKNTNRLLWYLQGADGVKTGTTNEAGHCLVASATRDGKQLIAVALNSGDRWGDCVRLLEYGFEKFNILTLARSARPVCRVKIHRGQPEEIAVYPRNDLIAIVKKEHTDLLESFISVPAEPLNAPLKAGQVIGTMGYRYQGILVEGVDLLINQAVRRKWWLLW